MTEIEKLFKNALVEDFGNPLFLNLLNEGLGNAYEEANLRTHEDSLISTPFKHYAFGSVRYHLTQSRFYECALRSDMKVEIDRCDSNGYPIAKVTFGRFITTLHFGRYPNNISCPQTSEIRRTNANLNKELIAPRLPGMSEKLKPVVIEDAFNADQIYVNFIHGSSGTGRNFADHGFFRVAIPYYREWKDSTTGADKRDFGFLANIDLRDVLGSLVELELERTRPVVKPLADVAMPKIKKATGEN